MIHSITFRRWKSFLDTKLYLDQIMVLIGMNASGKSNVLDALSLLKALADGEELQEALGNLRSGAEWCVLQGYDSFELEVEIHQNETEDLAERFTYIVDICVKEILRIKSEKILIGEERDLLLDTEYSEDFNNLEIFNHPDLNAAIKIPSNLSIMGNKVKFLVDSNIVRYISSLNSIFNKIFVLDLISKAIRGFPKISTNLQKDGSNIAGVIAALDDSKRQVVELQLNQYLTRLPEQDIGRVWVEKIGRLGSDAMLYCEETWPNGQKFIVDTRGMSDGTLRFLAILTALLTRPEGSNLIIEEVDNGLHPSRAKLLLEMLREIAVKRQIDVLVTTHNPALLDAMTPDYIGFITVVHRNPQGYSELTLLDEVDALPKLLASGRVGYLATTGKLDQAIEDQQEQEE